MSAPEETKNEHTPVSLRRISVVASHLTPDKIQAKPELNKTSVQSATDLERSSTTLDNDLIADLKKANKVELKHNKAGEPYFPMSTQQISVFIRQSQNPESLKYNSGTILHLEWGLDYDLIERCFNEAVRDHIMMHSTFSTHISEDGVTEFWVTVKSCPKLKVEIHRKGTFTLDPLQSLPERHVLVMDSGLVVRCDIFELDHPIMIVSCHQVAMDGVALAQFTNEVMRRYSGKRTIHPEIQQSYVKICASVARWQKRDLIPRHDTLREYWMSHLLGTEKDGEKGRDVHLPFLIVPTKAEKQIGREVKFDLKPYSKALSLACRQMGVRSVSVLFSLWIFLLSYYTNHEAVVVNTTFHGRTRPIFARILGSFATSLPVSVVVPSGATLFADFAQHINNTLTQHYFHQDYPVSQLLHDLKSARPEFSNLTYFSQAEFNYFQVRPCESPAVGSGIPDLLQAGANALSMWVFPGSATKIESDGLQVFLKYDCSILEPAFVEQIASHYESLVAKLLTNTQTTLSSLQASAAFDELSPDAFPTFPAVTKSLLATAALHIDRTALVCGDQALTYGAMLRDATRLALNLQQRGVVPNDVVGLICQRSVPAVVGMIGTVLAGAGYVVLDPSLPTARLQSMLNEIQCKQIVVQGAFGAPPQAIAEVPHAFLEDLVQVVDSKGQYLSSSVGPNHIAYAVFTSGSTGVPKAIAVPHSALANLVDWNTRHFSLGPDSVFLTPLQFFFDPHVMDIFASLVAGAKLVITKEGGSMDPMYLLDQIETHGVTHMNAVPSLLRMILTAPVESWKGRATSLRHVLVGGEALPWALVADAAEKLPSCTIWNMYGPAEATVVSTSYPATPNLTQGIESGTTWVPIGLPMQGVQTVVIGSHGFISPPGTVGELHIFGSNLSKGYLRQGLVTEPFVPHPSLKNCKMYKSGDLVRQRLDGVLEFVGRVDTQIKIRGHRIELGEINTVLMQLHYVAEATSLLVMINEKPSLVAYIVLKSGGNFKKSELDKALHSRLPSHMVPEFVLTIPSFVLTTNGKIDTKALPLPTEADRLKETVDFTPPQTPLEVDLCEIFSQVLKIKLGTSHNFFEVGGTSMTAIACLQKIQQKCGAVVSVQDFYNHPTVSQLGMLISNMNPAKVQEKRYIMKLFSAPQATPDTPSLFLIHGAIRAASVFAQLQESLPPNFPFNVYAVTEPDGVFSLGTTSKEPNHMNELIKPYLDEILRVQPRGPYMLAGYCMGGIIAIAMACKLFDMGHSVSHLIVLDTTAPTFNNAQGLLGIDSAMVHGLLAEELSLQNNYKSTLNPDFLRELTVTQQRACLVDELVANTELERDIAGRVVDRCVTFFKTGSKIMFTYDFPLPFLLPITVISATNKWTFYNQYNPQDRRDLGWGDLLPQGHLRVVETEGSHLTMVRKPFAKTLAIHLAEILTTPPFARPLPPPTGPVFNSNSIFEAAPEKQRTPPPTPGELTMDIVSRAAILAPSGHNTQPCRYFVADNRIHIFVIYVEDSAICIDPDYSFARVSAGCASEAMHRVANALGGVLEEHFFAGNAILLEDAAKHNKTIPAEWNYCGFMQLVKGPEQPKEEEIMLTWNLLEKRCSNRRKYQREPLEPSALQRIEQEISSICPDKRAVGVACIYGRKLQLLAEIVRQVDAMVFSIKPIREAIISSLGLDPLDHAKMFVGSLELSDVRVGAVSKLLEVSDDTFEFFQLHETFSTGIMESFLNSSGALVLLKQKNQSLGQDVEVGKKMMHMWLYLTSLGFSVQCFTFLQPALSKYKPHLTQALTARINEVVVPEKLKQTHTVAVMLRFGHALPPSHRSGRIQLAELSV